MRLIRLYNKDINNEKDLFYITDDSYHYLSKVLKVQIGQELIIFNNTGSEFYCEIIKIDNKKCEIKVNHTKFVPPNPYTSQITFSICKSNSADILIQKITELGVDIIQPIISENSIYTEKNINEKNKLSHWNKIIISAAEQSERSYLPSLKNIIPFSQSLDFKCDQKIILDTNSGDMISKKLNHKAKSFNILIGPEGDFTQEEYRLANKADFLSSSLGDNILKVETAAIAALSYLKITMNSKNE